MNKLIAFWLLLAGLGLAALEISWDSVPQVQPGIRLYRTVVEKPLMRVAIMRIDLQQPGLQFTATGRAEHWGEPMPDYPKCHIRTKRIKTCQFMQDCRKQGMPVIAAFNASPWTPWCKPWNHTYGAPIGTGILNGEIIWESRPSAEFVVYKNGKIDIVSEIPKTDYSKIQVAVSGFAIILKNGKALPYDKSRQPRIVFGLDAARKYLYVLTVDGRQPDWSIGATGAELSQFLLDAGAADGINMDGGGSATLCYWDDAVGKPVMVNHHKGGVMRNVASNVAVWIKPANR